MKKIKNRYIHNKLEQEWKNEWSIWFIPVILFIIFMFWNFG